ncbi:hypothetical protein QE152_g41338 [Popillia japonica]|uniref:Uncharacterized protein n=1 Tax=Popillia japonica TaxID=7064 RepID=A0AAW1GTY6_POPJA
MTLRSKRKRTQGPNESIGVYVSTMASLFSRLSIKVPEGNRIKIMVRNLSPFYQSQLGLVEIKSVEELLSIGRKLEWRKTCAERYVPPPRRQQSMEPDLAYMSSGSSVASVEANSRPALKCWNMVRNLSPFYQSQLGLVEIKSVEELLSIGRKLEWRKIYLPSIKVS